MPDVRRSNPLFALVNTCLLMCALALGCGPSDPLEAFRQQQAAGDFAATIEPLRELMIERRDDLEVHYLYGIALARTGQPSLAEWSLRKAMGDPKWLLPAGLQLVYDGLATGNHELAIQVAGTVLEAHPDNVNMLLLRANALARSRMHYEAALEDVDRVLELDPTSAEAMEPRILALLGLEQIEEAAEAIDELGRMIEESHLGPDSEGWHCATTAIFADDSDEDEVARMRWEDCLERFPGHANVVTSALRFFDTRREYDRSLEVLQAAHEASQASRTYRTLLAGRLRAAGSKQEAQELLEQATESDDLRSGVLAWFDLAKHYQDLGDHPRSSATLERAVALAREADVPHAQLLLEYADSLLLADRFDEALQVADTMTLEAHAAMIRARVAQQQGRHADARQYFDAAFRLWPNNPFARYYAAIAAEQLGDFDAAIEAYRYSIRIDAGATDARTRLAQLHLAEGQPREALAMLRLQAERVPLELEGEFLSVRLHGILGQPVAIGQQLERFHRASPQNLGQAMAIAAEGVRDRTGPENAVRLLVESPMDFEAPENAAALRALVRFAYEANRGSEMKPRVEAALRKNPKVAAVQEAHGLWLELGDAHETARAAYRSAIAIDSENAGALAGLGRLATNPDEARGLFERAAAAAPLDPDPAWGASQTLITAGKPSEAEARLEELLAKHPYEARAAAALVEMRLERGDAGERTAELAHRAVRFGGGIDALDLLGRVHRSRDEPKLAEAVEARARALRNEGPGDDEATLNPAQE